ncbi:cupin domain-containing protein [Patescibacteria group bacterium]|nr:cupin domain-containing protein [Patescibacteria group bacterium]
MTGFKTNIEEKTAANANFRQVLFTGKYSQLVVMSLRPGEEIGLEVHDIVDQFFRFEKGQGKVIIDGEEFVVADGDAVVVPAGSRHNVINTSLVEDLKLYTLYSPPNHPDGTIQATLEEAMAAEEVEHDQIGAPVAPEEPPAMIPSAPAPAEAPVLAPVPDTAPEIVPEPMPEPVSNPALEAVADPISTADSGLESDPAGDIE